MKSIAVQISPIFCIEALACWIYLRVLTFRSQILFCLIYFVQILINFTMRLMNVPNLIRSVIGIPVFQIGMPLIMSSDEFSVKLNRILLVNFGTILAELLGSSIYAVITGGQMIPNSVASSSIPSIAMVYVHRSLLWLHRYSR